MGVFAIARAQLGHIVTSGLVASAGRGRMSPEHGNDSVLTTLLQFSVQLLNKAVRIRFPQEARRHREVRRKPVETRWVFFHRDDMPGGAPAGSKAGVSEPVAMQLCGHKTRKIIDRYFIVSEQDLREGVAKLAAQAEREAPAAR